MKKLLLTLLLAFPLFAFMQPDYFKESIGNDKILELMKSGVPLVDIRTPGEWKQTGIVEKSHPIMFFDEKGQYDAPAFLAELNKVVPSKESPVMLICRTGSRTKVVANWLAMQGYKNVYNVQNGIMLWLREGYPTVRP